MCLPARHIFMCMCLQGRHLFINAEILHAVFGSQIPEFAWYVQAQHLTNCPSECSPKSHSNIKIARGGQVF
jgi:hypothetical protein